VSRVSPGFTGATFTRTGQTPMFAKHCSKLIKSTGLKKASQEPDCGVHHATPVLKEAHDRTFENFSDTYFFRAQKKVSEIPDHGRCEPPN
jgi:hypothetical protein